MPSHRARICTQDVHTHLLKDTSLSIALLNLVESQESANALDGAHGSLHVKLGPLQFNLGPLQIKPGFLQLKFGSLHLKSGPHDARELSRTWRFQRVSNLITLPVGRNATPRRRNSSTWDTKPFLKMFISGQN